MRSNRLVAFRSPTSSPVATMSAWSSSTGKAQLSYADRLRQASQSSAPSRQDPSSSRSASQQGNKASASASSSLGATSPQASRRLSTASSASAATASGSAARASSNPSDANDSSSTGESGAKSAGPPVNVWDARRKQIADREAEKERERQASLAQQRKVAAAASSSAGANTNAPGKQSKQTATASSTGSRKLNERHSKGSSTSGPSDRKSSKQASQPSQRPSNPVPISSQASTAAAASDKPNAPAAGSRASNAATTPKSTKADGRTFDEPRSVSKAAPQASGAQTAPTTASNKAEAADKVQKAKAEDKGKTADSAKTAQNKVEPSAGVSRPAQNAAAKVPPSTALSVQTSAAPMPALHDDIPASPATVASAIEEVLKNGGVNGAQTEDDDAWLARIHLLNGGQNMPKFGGFGPNGVSALSDEAETQAAKKAERAVAAAWGAGKSVWTKSQQQYQSKTAASSDKDVEAVAADIVAAKDPVSTDTPDDAAQKSTDGASAPTPAPVSVNGATATEGREPSSSAAAPKNQKAPTDAKAEKAGTEGAPPKKAGGKEPREASERAKTSKGASQPQQAKPNAPSVPPFEDVNNWPSPLDAGKKAAEKPKASTSSSEHDAAAKASQPKTQKSFYETLDELQLRLAPGANPQQPGNAAGTRKGKQQWVSILPEITHTSASSAGAKQHRPTAADAKAGKGANKQQARKDGNKGGAQTQTSQSGAKKEGGNKGVAKDKTQSKENNGDASSGAKASDGRGKNDNRAQLASQGDKDGAAAKLEASARPKASSTSTSQPRAATMESKPSSGVSQTHEVAPSQTSGGDASSAVPASAAVAPAEPTTSSEPTSVPQPRPEPTVNPKPPRAARTHLRPNGTPNSANLASTQSNGLRQPKSGASTPGTNRSSPRGSVASSPQVHALPRTMAPSDPFAAPAMFYGPSGAATPMHAAPNAGAAGAPAPWLPYNPYNARAPVGFMFDATAPLPQGVLGQLLGQIEFYFSQHNLQGDFFLRQKMDAQGWVDIAVVAGFKRVQGITRDVEMVKDALLYSAVLDVDEEGMRVRKRFGWEMYTLAPAGSHGGEETQKQPEPESTEKETLGDADDEPALGVVAASGFGGTLEG